MGLSGLWNYTDRHRLSIPHRLHNTKLVIDGNSFSKYLFESVMSRDDGGLKRKYFYAGDYADYSAQVRLFFGQLAHCDIEPIVIFDGCSKMDMEPSVRLVQHRDQYEERLRNVVKLCESGGQVEVNIQQQRSNQSHWPSMSTVLFEVMRQLGIVHRQCVTNQPDDIIPVIARYYNCPVLTSDSDFLLWDLPGGVIPMQHFFQKYFNYAEFTSSSKYIECSINYRESGLLAHLESKYGFKPELLPLVGPLFGYDHVDGQIATRFLSHATQHQLAKLKVTFKSRIGTVLQQQFASQFTHSFRENVIVKYFTKSTLGKLDSSFESFSSVSVRELQKVVQRLIEKLNEILSSKSSSSSSIDLDLNTLNRIGQQFIDDLAQFEKDGESYNSYDRSLAAFRWISSQPTLDKAKEKLGQFCVEVKLKNLELVMKNACFRHNSWYKPKKTFRSVEFDRFLAHVKTEIPVSLLYEDLEPKVRQLEPNLPIDEFLDIMQDALFPQAAGIPSVFHRNLVHGITNPYLLNVLYTKLVLIPSPIENYATLSSSSYVGTFDLDPYIYGMILGGKEDDDQQVTRIYREGTKLVHVQVQPKFEIKDGKPLPNLEQISRMAESDRRGLLFAIIKQVCFAYEVNIDELIVKIQRILPERSQPFGDALLLMILALIMAAHKCPTELTCQPEWSPFVRAMLFNILLMGYVGHEDSGVPTLLDFDQDRIEPLFRDIPVPAIDLTISHCFNSYHNCLQSLNFLTQLLNLYECFELDRFVCGLQGSFVHALTQELMKKAT